MSMTDDNWKQEIQDLKARYCRYLDTKQWQELRKVFADNAVFVGNWAKADNADQFVENVAKTFADVTSIHQVFMPEIVRTSDNRARAIWAMTDYVAREAGELRYLGESLPGQWGFRGYGHYEEEYRYVDGCWKIALWRLTRLRIDPLVGDRPSLAYEFPSLTPGWID